ncbi:hypothetical protein niasHS_013814 [Heterodera schachtii]|uniref:Uncharacterized protein n=1 Tax=Heterodera schachtii TaxID=97005 RepID=A0ABD2ILW8_HETSC
MARNFLAITFFLAQLFLLLIDGTFGGICMSKGVKRSQSAPNLHQTQQQRRASARSKTVTRSVSASSSIQSIPTPRYNEQAVQETINYFHQSQEKGFEWSNSPADDPRRAQKAEAKLGEQLYEQKKARNLNNYADEKILNRSCSERTNRNKNGHGLERNGSRNGLIKQRSLNGLPENVEKRNAKNLKGIERHGQPTLGQLLTRDTIDHANDKQSYKARQRKGKQTLAQPYHDAFNDATNEQKFGKQRQRHGEQTLGQLLANDPEFWEEKQRNKQNTKRKNKMVADNKQKQLEKGGSLKKKGKAKGKAK